MRLWVEKWMLFHAFALLIGSGMTWYLGQLSFLIGFASFSFAVLYLWQFVEVRNARFLIAPANIVTTFRLISLFLLLLFQGQLSPWAQAGIALGVLLADGLDGYLARRFNTASSFGQYLDMETDAFYVLCLSTLLFFESKVGPWILLVGALRYLYFVVLWLVKPPERKEHRRFNAQLVAVIMMSTLIGGFIIPAPWRIYLLIIASVLIFYSFGFDFYWTIKAKLQQNKA